MVADHVERFVRLDGGAFHGAMVPVKVSDGRFPSRFTYGGEDWQLATEPEWFEGREVEPARYRML